MSCGGCIDNQCLDCVNGNKRIVEIKRGQHIPTSAWERRWIKWAKK